MSVGVQLTHGVQLWGSATLCPDPGPRAGLSVHMHLGYGGTGGEGGTQATWKGDEDFLEVQGQRPCHGRESCRGVEAQL